MQWSHSVLKSYTTNRQNIEDRKKEDVPYQDDATHARERQATQTLQDRQSQQQDGSASYIDRQRCVADSIQRISNIKRSCLSTLRSNLSIHW